MRRTLIRIVAVALLLYSLWSLASVRLRLSHALEREQNMLTELKELEQEGSRLQARLDSGFDNEYLEALHRRSRGKCPAWCVP